MTAQDPRVLGRLSILMPQEISAIKFRASDGNGTSGRQQRRRTRRTSIPEFTTLDALNRTCDEPQDRDASRKRRHTIGVYNLPPPMVRMMFSRWLLETQLNLSTRSFASFRPMPLFSRSILI